MNLNDLFRLSFRQIIRHRRRYWGVILAISLGIGGLITVIMVSRDFKRNLNRDLTLIGGVTVIKASFDNHLTSWPTAFKPQTREALRHLPGVEHVSAIAFQVGQTNLITGQLYTFTVMALDEDFWQVRSFWAMHGTLFGPEAVFEKKKELVLGESLAKKVFGHYNVAGRTMNINNESYRVTGVLGGITDSGLASTAYLPITTVQDRFPGLIMADRVYLRCATLDDVAPVAAAITGVVQKYQSADQLQVEVLWEGLRRVQKLFWWAELFIYVAIGITLLLGGMGIWNVMMAAVRSRTREIGLKKAVGADDVDILKQFLAEAVALSLGASFMGVILGRMAVAGLSCIIDLNPAAHLFFISVGLGLIFGMFLGIGAGLFPSIKASRMDVVDAVRYE
ncbi:MAG: ABC transporter permease [Desulfuromonadaceae bacterium]